jgi:hypothetical protein
MKGKTGNSGGEKEPWETGREIFKGCPLYYAWVEPNILLTSKLAHVFWENVTSYYIL